MRRSKQSEASVIVLKKSHKYLAQTGLMSLPSGRIDKRYTGIGATSMEITDESRNSIIVCPTVALASSKAIWAKEKFRNKPEVSIHYVGSQVAEIPSSEPNDIINALMSGKRTKVIAVVDSFVRYFNSDLRDYRENFHLVVDEADALQRDVWFRSIMEDCLDLYCEFPPKKRTMISATWYESVLKKITSESLTVIKKEEEDPVEITVYNVKGYLPYFVGRRIKMQLLKRRNTKILVAANSFALIHEIMVSGAIEEKDVSILCSDASEFQAAYLKKKITDGRLPDKKVIFMTSAYFIGIDILDDVIIHVVSDVRYDSSILSPQQIFQIVGRARGRCTSKYFYYNQFKGKAKVKDLKGLKQEASEQLKVLQRSDARYQKIEQYNSLPSGCFYRMRDGKLTLNLLLFDFRLKRYKIKQGIYSNGSDSELLLSEYFKTKLEQVSSLLETDTKVVKVKRKIRDYKAKLFRSYATSHYCWFNTPFVDSEIVFAHSLIYRVPNAALERYRRWCYENAERYSLKMLKDMKSRLDKYGGDYHVNVDGLANLLREFDEMDDHWKNES